MTTLGNILFSLLLGGLLLLIAVGVTAGLLELARVAARSVWRLAGRVWARRRRPVPVEPAPVRVVSAQSDNWLGDVEWPWPAGRTERGSETTAEVIEMPVREWRDLEVADVAAA